MLEVGQESGPEGRKKRRFRHSTGPTVDLGGAPLFPNAPLGMGAGLEVRKA